MKKDKYFKSLVDYKHEDIIRIALYAVEDCTEFTTSRAAKDCIEIVRDWLSGKKANKKEIQYAVDKTNYVSNADIAATYAAYTLIYSFCVTSVVSYAASSFPCDIYQNKFEEYKQYAQFFSHKDTDFPYLEQARTFNLDDVTDLNIFLDFLVDNYPSALIYPREDFLTKKLCKEYLKVIYQ